MHRSLTLARAAPRTPLAILVAIGCPKRGLHEAMGAVTVALIGCVLLVAATLAHPLVDGAPLLPAQAFLELMQVQ